jgi:aspartyl-tRNA(Asn)/glutamyl-tRNA(Gln) amidotransferase subunit C
VGDSKRIGPDEVRRIARLARLELTPEEVVRFAGQLAAVLEHAAALEAVDVTGVPPTSHAIPTLLPERADRPEPSLPRDVALALAPDVEDGAYRVPKIVEG